jgi:hypothetical protein
MMLTIKLNLPVGCCRSQTLAVSQGRLVDVEIRLRPRGRRVQPAAVSQSFHNDPVVLGPTCFGTEPTHVKVATVERDDGLPRGLAVSAVRVRSRPITETRLYPRSESSEAASPMTSEYPNFMIRRDLGEMERKGIEPSTSALRTLRSPN